MRVPHTVCPHTCSVYCSDPAYSGNELSGETEPDSLERLVLRTLAANIQGWCPWLLQALGAEHATQVLEELSLDLPLHFCVKNVPDGFYWQRLAIHRWPLPEHGVCDVLEHGGSWRRLVLERHLEELVEQSSPPRAEEEQQLAGPLRSALRDAGPHVRRLRIRQLQVAQEEARGHLSLGPVLAKLPHLQELRLRVGPRNCRLRFTWEKFTLSPLDAVSLGQGLLYCTNLTTLKLCSSHVNDETLALVLQPQPPKHENDDTDAPAADDSVGTDPPPLLTLPSLTYLDLSHNELTDGAADTLTSFLASHPTLSRLRLVNNKLGGGGAARLAAAVRDGPCGLTELDLSLNQLGDVGGTALASCCPKLHVLRLAACHLGVDTATCLTRVLRHGSSALTQLDLTNNHLLDKDSDADVFIAELRSYSKSLQQIDMRMTGRNENVIIKIQCT